LGLLLKAVEEHHGRAVQAEQDAGADLEQPSAEPVDQRFARGPLPLDEVDVSTDGFLDFDRQVLQPLAHRFAASRRAVEPACEDWVAASQYLDCT